MRLPVLALLSAVAAAPLVHASLAHANDSTAELATGGLVFVRNDNIEMRSEDLSISAKEVSVRYRFFNKSETPVTVLVAFPMPEISVTGPDDNVSIPTEDPVNLLGFTTVVDGKPITNEVEQRVTAAGIDRTELLKSLNVPLAPHLPTAGDALDKLPRDRQDELVRLGLAEIEEFDAGKGIERHMAPRWTLRTTFYRQQTFAPKAETVIEHRYRPSVGQTVQTHFADPANAKDEGFDDFRRKYCIDKAFYAAVEKARRANKGDVQGPPFSEERIEYVLRTGANWAGAIGEFRLTVDKGDPDSLVSFCGDGVKRVGPTRFEMRQTDFVPERDLSILILRRLSLQ